MEEAALPTNLSGVLRERSFHDVLGEAAGLASLSPSSHNSQPWALARMATGGARAAAAGFLGIPEGGDEEYLVLALDRRRALTALPAHTVEMAVSCGAYWRLLLRALTAQGWSCTRTRACDEA